jgi:hypothetical protein
MNRVLIELTIEYSSFIHLILFRIRVKIEFIVLVDNLF